MRGFSSFSFLLTLVVTGVAASAQPRASFMEHGEITRAKGMATCTAKSPRPLLQAVTAVAEEYGWGVNFEDPAYNSTFDLVDDTDPAWRAAHPNSPGVRIVRGGEFHTQYAEVPQTAHSPTERAQVLSKVVADYNASGNPGKFAVRAASDGRFDVVGVGMRGNSGEAQSFSAPLDTPVSIPAFSGDGMVAITAILNAVSAKNKAKIVLGGAPANALMGVQITLSSDETPARELLAQVLAQTHRKLFWESLYDADTGMFYFSLLPVTRTQYDTSGRRTLVFIN